MPDQTGRTLEVRWLGRMPYGEALRLQEEAVHRRKAGKSPDQLFLLEHPHVITAGTSASEDNILVSAREREELGLEVFQVGRGGDVTYHGPGQLIGYPVLSLAPDRKDLHRYLRDLEGVLLAVLSEFGIEGHREDGLTGVWTDRGKVAALGVRVSSGWITSHGFALNVSPDLAYFDTIIPCGITDRSVTSISGILGREVGLQEVIPAVVRSFAAVFDRTAVVV